MKHEKKYLHLFNSDEGFTLIELTAVVVILGILGSLGIGNITRWIKLSKIDQASSLLSNSLVECLQITRGGTDPTTVGPPDDVIDNNRLESSGYKIKTSKDKCADFFITPISSDEKVLFEMGYQITADNQVTKIATPADNQSSLIRCKRWAGPNCGASEEQKAAWAAAALLATQKKDCQDNFYAWLNDTPPNGGTGTFNRWDSSSGNCNLPTYAFEGSIVANQAAIDSAQEAKLGAICNAKVLQQRDLNPPPSKMTTLDECPGKTFYFCLGVDKQTEAGMNACIAANQEQVCIADRERARLDNYSGKYEPRAGPGSCGQAYWMCNQVQYSSESDYNSSSCYGSGGSGSSEITQEAKDCLAKEPANNQFWANKICRHLGNASPTHSLCKNFYYCMGE